jgi:hypothetical protein
MAYSIRRAGLLLSIYEKIYSVGPGSGLVALDNNPKYENLGFKSLGYDFFQVNKHHDLATEIENEKIFDYTEDIINFKKNIPPNGELELYILYPPEIPITIKPEEMITNLEAFEASVLFLFDDQGGGAIIYWSKSKEMKGLRSLDSSNGVALCKEETLIKENIAIPGNLNKMK